MERTRVRNPGWTAFDRKQREQHVANAEPRLDSFPPISEIVLSSPVNTVTTNSATLKPFSSVVNPLKSAETRVYTAIELLKNEHSWADQNLIEDILAAVNGDVHQTSAILKSMFSPNHKLSAPEKPSPSPTESVVENKISNDFREVVVASKLLTVPTEPEWEEDDVYLSHRKDAMKMMRAASHHSRAASNAFLRGDHVAANQLSLKARDEQMTAERLNNKAAEEILLIRNANNSIWKIDLHGLHASEAIDALKKQLDQIESVPKIGRASSPNEPAIRDTFLGQPSTLEPVKSFDVNSKAKYPLPQNRNGILEVITGSGKHSRGQATLPAAVQSFLIENGYRFDEPRPGVVAVRPKFRHK